MKKIKVSEAKGRQLDWLVAECEGHGDRWLSRWREGGDRRFTYCEVVYKYTERPEQMWPIIEREGISVVQDYVTQKWVGAFWHEHLDFRALSKSAGSPSALIAAARCYVVSKLGEEVEVPDELC